MVLGHQRCRALKRDQAWFSRELEEGKNPRPTGSTGCDLAAFCVELTPFSARGIRLLRHTCADALLTFSLKTRRLAAAMRRGGITACTAQARDQFPHKTRADGKALGELSDGAFLMRIGGQHLLAHI